MQNILSKLLCPIFPIVLDDLSNILNIGQVAAEADEAPPGLEIPDDIPVEEEELKTPPTTGTPQVCPGAPKPGIAYEEGFYKKRRLF